MDISQRAHDEEFGEDGPSESELAEYARALEGENARLAAICRLAAERPCENPKPSGRSDCGFHGGCMSCRARVVLEGR